MRNTVTRLKPRNADFGTALSAFRLGDFLCCAESLSADVNIEAVTLRSRAFLRLNRYAEALDVISGLNTLEFPHEYAGELLAVKSAALIGLGDVSVDSALTDARARAFSSGFVPVECEVEYTASLAAWTIGDLDGVVAGISRLLELGENSPSPYASCRTDYLYSSAFWRSRALELRGLTEALREDYAAQAASIADAFREYDRGNVQDNFIEGRMLANLAILVRDLDANELASYVENRAERIAWNEHNAHAQFSVFQSIGWNRARRGDHLGAFRNLRRSASCAPSIPLQISATLGRAFLARELGEVFTAGEDLEHALRLTKQFDWSKSVGSERDALFELARQLAPHDAKQARSLWDRYVSLKPGTSSLMLSGQGDRRQRADECSAHAAVLLAEGQRRRAISLLLESFDIWTEVGYAWRAAAIAADLALLTGENRYCDIAAREASKQPNSWLSKRLAVAAADASP